MTMRVWSRLPSAKPTETGASGEAQIDTDYVPQYEFVSHIPRIEVKPTANATQASKTKTAAD